MNLRKGFCVIDFGVKYNGYCSDMTRTVFIGKPTKKDRELYDLLLQAQEECVAMVKSGIVAKDIDSHARKVLGKYSKYFIHGLGHQLGIEIHENSKRGINKRGNFKLKEGMVITIEPGIYLPRRGGVRIEDDVLINESGLESLTDLPRKLEIIAA